MSWQGLLSHASSYLVLSAPYAAAGALLIAMIAACIAWAAHRRVRALAVRGGDSLEDTLGELIRRVKELQLFREELEEYLKHAESRLQKGFRGFGMVRFNPFHGDGSGGNQSFALALINEHGDGITISALYTRAGATSMYAKPVEKGKPKFQLTEEEEDALRQAKESLRAPRALAGSRDAAEEGGPDRPPAGSAGGPKDKKNT